MREIFALVDRLHTELEVGAGERREEKGENSPDYRQSVGWSCVECGWSYVKVWVDVGPSTKCGMELRLSVVSVWGWS